MRHAVIMAGGVGSRLWPVSRKAMPKQFQKLIGDQSLLQQTYQRINKIIPSNNIWIQTAESYRELVLQQLPGIKAERIISEPAARGTAPATGLAALKILQTDPEAVLFGLLPADHYVGKEDIFCQATEKIFEFLEKNPQYVATIGIQPTEPNTGYGYIKKGDQIGKSNSFRIYNVESFVEKPDKKTAVEFLKSGDYLWNGGYYLFNGAQIKEYFRQLLPETLTLLEQFLANPKEVELYKNITNETFDTAISEKINHLAVIPAAMDWSDIGNWAAIHDILLEKEEANHVLSGRHIGSGSENTLIIGGNKLIATVGLKDVVVIDTDDVLLICHKGNAQNVKKIVEELELSGEKEYL